MDDKTIKERFWEILPIKMAEAGMRQVDLAEAMNMNKATISLWVRGQSFPEMDNIQRIADVLNCKTDDLLGRELPETDVDFDKLLISSYHAANESIQSAVCKLLDIKGRRKNP